MLRYFYVFRAFSGRYPVLSRTSRKLEGTFCVQTDDAGAGEHAILRPGVRRTPSVRRFRRSDILFLAKATREAASSVGFLWCGDPLRGAEPPERVAL